jgi:hypothetical protein
LQIERKVLSAGPWETRRDINLKNLIIASFIPAAHQEKIMRHAHRDEFKEPGTLCELRFTGHQ